MTGKGLFSIVCVFSIVSFCMFDVFQFIMGVTLFDARIVLSVACGALSG